MLEKKTITKVADGVVKKIQTRKVETAYDNDDIFDTLLYNFKSRTAQMGTSVRKLAISQGYSPQSVDQWTYNPTLSTLIKLADLVALPVYALLDPDFDTTDYKLKKE